MARTLLSHEQYLATIFPSKFLRENRGVDHVTIAQLLIVIYNDAIEKFQGKRITKQGALPSMGSILGALDVNNFWQLLDKMAKQVPLEDPWNAPCALEWDTMTVKQLIDQKCWTR